MCKLLIQILSACGLVNVGQTEVLPFQATWNDDHFSSIFAVHAKILYLEIPKHLKTSSPSLKRGTVLYIIKNTIIIIKMFFL